MDVLLQLDRKEEELLKAINRIVGSLEEKVEQLTAEGIFEVYKEIHFQYAELAEGNEEACKQGLFLQWYAQVEPPFLSGIDGLIVDAEKKILAILDYEILHSTLDEELAAMLSYYGDWEFMFEGVPNYKNIESFLQNKFSHAESMKVLKNSDFKGRGQMGAYWRSVL